MAGDKLTIEPFSLASGPVNVIVDVVDSGVDAQTRSFTVSAILDNADDIYRPGMSFRVAFERQGERLPSLPEAALLYGCDGAYIWTVEDGCAVRTPVDVASRISGRVLLRGNITDNSIVVTEGVQKIRYGSALDIEMGDTPSIPTSRSGGVSLTGPASQ